MSILKRKRESYFEAKESLTTMIISDKNRKEFARLFSIYYGDSNGFETKEERENNFSEFKAKYIEGMGIHKEEIIKVMEKDHKYLSTQKKALQGLVDIKEREKLETKELKDERLKENIDKLNNENTDQLKMYELLEYLLDLDIQKDESISGLLNDTIGILGRLKLKLEKEIEKRENKE